MARLLPARRERSEDLRRREPRPLADPVRRLRQHNGELSGGGAPAAGRPWRILLVVRGFSSKSDALAFEWAWQKPHTSRHIARQWGVKGFGKCGTRSKVSVRLAALALLLVHGHWAACALHVRVCAPEECGQALQDVRRAAAGLTCGPP